MTTTKQSWFKRSLAVLLAVMLVMSMGVANVFAAGTLPDNATKAIHLDAPVEDGVYRGTVNLVNASNPNQYSMGNSALRGSDSYNTKNPSDAGYQSLIIVKDGKATAVLQMMPMGYLGTYGFLMELDSVYPEYFQYGPIEEYTTYTPAEILATHKTKNGDVVYDDYNNPDSKMVYDGYHADNPNKNKRPGGFGKEESYVDIDGEAYPWILAVDVTPVAWDLEDKELPTTAEEFTADEAAYCHVFVPVMFSISQSSGDQYARLNVDWTGLTKIEDPSLDLEYQLYQAKQIEQGSYSDETYQNLQDCISEIIMQLSNRWPSQTLEMSGESISAAPVINFEELTAEKTAEILLKLKTAVDSLAEPVDTSALTDALNKAKEVSKILYTDESYAILEEAMEAGEALLNGTPTELEVAERAQAILDAIKGLVPISSSEGWDGTTVKQPVVSYGTASVETAEELAWVAQQINSGSEEINAIFLQGDIDLNGKEWTPIGTKSNPFTGRFYGNGHTVSNLLITSDNDYLGLFGYVQGADGDSASISDITVVGNIETTGKQVGGVVGYAQYADLSYVRNEVDITVNKANSSDMLSYTGGVVGEASLCDIDHASNSGEITVASGQDNTGGIVGYTSKSYIRHSSNSGKITAGGYTGGIVGHYNVRSGAYGVTDCYNTGNINGRGGIVGGIAGYVSCSNGALGVLAGLYNRGNITGQNNVGGIVGYFSGGNMSSVTGVYSTGAVTATTSSTMGNGVIGRMQGGLVYNVYALEGTGSMIVTTTGSSEVEIVRDAEFRSEAWFQSEDFFTDMGSYAKYFSIDTESINGGYPVLASQMEDILKKTKEDALTQLNAYKNADDYKGLSQTAISQIKEDAAEAIGNAATIAQVEELLAKAKSNLDAIPNDANYGLDLTELKEKLAEAKELEAKGGELYTAESWNSLTATIAGVEYLLESGFGTQDKVTEYTGHLTTNMKGLTYKGADYSAVDAALELVPEDLSSYTEESVKVVEDAVAAVIRGFDITKQDEVNAMAAAISDAVKNLVKTGSPDKTNLKDGVYSVYGEMIKTNRTEKSMSNDAINHTIKLTVGDGKYYLTIDFHGLAYLNKFGYLAELSYYDNGYTYGQYGTVEGTLIPATVLSTQKNADGSNLYDEFNQAGGSYEGKLYPDQIEFPLVADALADEDGYVPLHVFVPVMEDISAGTGDQDVLLKLDWSTLKETTEDDPAFEPEEPVEQSPAVDFTDSATGVKVNADKGVFDEGIQIVVSEITSRAAYDSAASSLSDVGKKFKLYDIKFLDADGNEVAPNGTVSISFPVAAGYDSANLAVYRMADGGKVLVRGTVENGYYTVITKTAGTYALVEKGSTITDAENTENAGNQNQGNTNIPQTGGSSNMAVYALLALAAGMMGVTLVTRKRKSDEV
ncbi:MAG: NEAT domain-containing protein [Clostridiales bacterium]|nr:NEAT domain-containing protein [Clostridiales bacterium]